MSHAVVVIPDGGSLVFQDLDFFQRSLERFALEPGQSLQIWEKTSEEVKQVGFFTDSEGLEEEGWSKVF